MSIYFTITTMTTVGYGDMSPGTTVEMVYGIFIMILGVVVFNFISGALSSIIQEVDSTSSNLQTKILFLNKIKDKYNISNDLYNECRAAFNYDNVTTLVGLDGFIKSLPTLLSQKVTIKMHKKTLGNSDLFRVLKNRRLLAHIGHRMRP